MVKIQSHPTHPWLVDTDASDFISVWNWGHRQIAHCAFSSFMMCVVCALAFWSDLVDNLDVV